MISRKDIEDEAAMIQHMIELTKPTGLDHTPTPWKPHNNHGLFEVLDDRGERLALFKREADRDLALFFANSHAAIIGLIKHTAGAFDFIAMGTEPEDQGLRDFANKEAELARIYADLFARLGKPEELCDGDA